MVFPLALQSILDEIKNSKEGDVPILITRYGRLFEQLFLGFTLSDNEVCTYREDEYLPFLDAVEEMKNLQPVGYDPSHPTEGCNKEFFSSVESFLRVGSGDLEYYICVGTKLDFWHGVDALFSWRGMCVSIDVTVNTEKKYKADFLITPPLLVSGEVYTLIARDIALLLITRKLNQLSQKPMYPFSQPRRT